MNYLSDESYSQEAQENAWVEKAIADVMSVGADRKTALRWLYEADADAGYYALDI